MSEILAGYVDHIVYHNEENGYTVMIVETDDDEMTCIGNFQPVHGGEYIEAEGEYTVHPTYGPQFKAVYVRVTIPQEGIALRRYLASGAIKGIGEALADRIMKKFGDETLRIMEEEPERLAEVKGISEKKARDIGEQVLEKSQMREAMIFLGQYGISMNLAVKIYNRYQDSLYRVIKENPYRLADDIQGVGFKIADEIASRMGFHADSEFRIKSGLQYVLNRASSFGHMYLPKELLLRQASDLLGVPAEEMEKFLFDLMIEKKLVVRQDEGNDEVRVYTEQAYFLELNTARMLHELNIRTKINHEEVLEEIAAIEKKNHMELDVHQREAVCAAAENGIMILTGGPGTGKTTAINTMIQYFRSQHMHILLAAPTGRAAKRMTETTGFEASTIHRMLELSGAMEDDSSGVMFERNADNPLETDVIIIDEMSMVDMYLIHALLSAVVPGTRLVFVGDQDQLPSVGPGSVLKDMIRSGCFSVITLTHIFRQAQTSDIIVNAHKINAGQPVEINNNSKDFYFLKRDDVKVIQKVVLTLVSEKLPKYVHAQQSDIQVLAPMRKGPLGVENLNVILQRYLNPEDPMKQEKEHGSGLFREGDKVMQIRNNYQIEWELRGRNGFVAQKGMGVFNGDIGVIREISHQTETLTVEFDEGKMVEYTFKQLDELELAYATTIHKAQGSEYPAVVIPLLGGPRMLMTRNLLYTAVTRARKCVILTGSEETFRQMIKNETEENRYTTLAQCIREMSE